MRQFFKKIYTSNILKDIVEFTTEMAFPKDIKCIVCDDELDKDNRYGICKNCEITVNIKHCMVCGKGIKDMSPVCDECKGTNHYYKFARGALLYTNHVVNLIRKYKFGGAKYLAQYFCEWMLDCYFENNYKCDVVTFVPLHEKKLRIRGYNQAYELANIISININKDIVNALIKSRQSIDTAKLSREQRVEAVKGTFCLDESCRELIQNKSILLIDDVYTTGVTVNECSRILKQGGAKQVVVLTIATSFARPLDIY